MNEAGKNFRKALAVVGAISTLATSASCAKSKPVQKEHSDPSNINLNDKNSYNSLHGNPNYYEKDEIFAAYTYIANKLKNKDSLNNEEIIEITNTYKKLISSIDYIDCLSENPDYSVMEQLPKMEGLLTDIKNELVGLIDTNNLLLLPNNPLDFQKKEILEKYLTYTDNTPLEELKIIKSNECNKYYILSDANFFFEVYLSTDGDGTIYLSPETLLSQNDINRISLNAIPITETTEAIPSINVNELNEDLSR